MSFAIRVCLLVVVVPTVLLAQGGQAPAPAPITPLAPDAMFTVAVAMPVLEAAPIHIADQGPSGSGFRVIDGGGHIERERESIA